MREIEFRARDIETDKFVYGSYIDHLEIIKNEHDSFDIDVYTLGQYIGLTDKNGKKIFECDVVAINGNFEEVGVIKWDKDTSMFVICVENIIYTFDEFYGYELEVIGNLYDNPELIGE